MPLFNLTMFTQGVEFRHNQCVPSHPHAIQLRDWGLYMHGRAGPGIAGSSSAVDKSSSAF